MLNTCKCGGEVYIRYDIEPTFGTHYTAVCEDCGAVHPLKANNKLDAVREWNECKDVGDVQMTNDEWRKTCSTEEYAAWLWKNFDCGDVIILWEKYGCPYKDDNGVRRADYTEAMKKWLEEKHV